MESHGPDFKGRWYDPHGPDHANTYSDFNFFIDSKITDRHGILIRGRITDIYGDATFSGDMSGTRITFTKIYSEKARRNPAVAPAEMFYDGINVNGKFSGKFIVFYGENVVLHEGTFEMQQA